ncbi:TonB-dependent siderophore receptor [Agaribacter marinus]|uniref:TonB-dependent receptor n=1 Tax=Agaribacter marinus TaxID=1431249 RepID=A0AA37SZI3_9ALTE|nr:TonB-dependent siderophore receptor [Agaribacter marinus]GLR71504.1 TonB-dependent receptor [Agaribacter marinus]
MDKHNFKRAALAVAMSATASLAFANTPNSPSDNNANQDVEVFEVLGERRAYTGNFAPLETPAANQVIDLQTLSDAGVLSLDDALDLSASVSRQNNFGGLWNAFSIRGFSGDINLPSGFLVNGFNAGRGFGGPRDLVGIASVEVLKGPRSALFGRGEPGGTVNLTTKRPTYEKGGYVKASLGSWSQLRVEGDYQAILDKNEDIGLRLVGFYEDAESFRPEVETQKQGFYPSLKWSISDQTNLTYELEYTSQELPFDRGVVYSDEFGFSPRDVFVGEAVPIETEVLGHQLEVQHDFNDEWSFLGGLGYRETSLEGDAFEPQFGSRQTYFRDGETISRFFRSRDFESDYLVLRGELSGSISTGSIKHRLIIGADYDKFDNTLVIDRYRSRFNGDLAALTPDDISTHLLLNINNPVYGVNLNPDPGANTNRNEELTGYGIYVQDQLELGENLQVRLGLRYDDFEQDLTNFLASPADTVTTDDSRVSPQVGAVYSLSEGTSLFASYGEGYRQQTGQDFAGNQFAPNITESTEVGVKISLDSVFESAEGLLNVTLFQVKQSNFLVNDDRPEATAVGFFSIAAGEAESTGLEVDANIEFENSTSIWFSYAYTDAEFLSTFADVDGFGFTINAGDPLINTPEHQASIQAAKVYDVASTQLRVGGGLLYVGERNGWVGSDFNLPSYTTTSVFTEADFGNNVVLRLDVENLFDKTFYTNSYANVWVEPGTPRSARITVSYKF